MLEAVYGPKWPQSGGDCGLTQAGLQSASCCPELFGVWLLPGQTQLTAISLLASKNNYDHLHSRNVERTGTLNWTPEASNYWGVLWNLGLDPYNWEITNKMSVVKSRKTGWRNNPCRHRTICLTSVICKAFELILKDSIIKNMEINRKWDKSAHGFTRSKSCQPILMSLIR